MSTIPKYKCNVKYNDITASGSISSEDQDKWLIPRRSAHLKKRLANTTPIEIKSKFSSLISNSTPTVHAIRNLNDNNIHDDLPLTKKHHGQPKVLMIQSYSIYQRNNFRHLKN